VVERQFQVVERQKQVAERRSGPFRLNLTTGYFNASTGVRRVLRASCELIILFAVCVTNKSARLTDVGFGKYGDRSSLATTKCIAVFSALMDLITALRKLQHRLRQFCHSVRPSSRMFIASDPCGVSK